MANNFNLRTFLTENKLTKNAQLLKEEQEDYKYFDEEGTGGFYMTTIDGHKIYSMEDSSVMDTCFYAIIDPDGNEEFVGIDVAGEPISSEEIQNEYEIQSNIADFIEADINAELGDGLDENKLDEARYSDSYDTPAAKAVNAKAEQIVGTIRGYSTALQTIQDAIKQVEQEVGSEATRSEKSTLESHLLYMFRNNMEMEREGTQNKKPIMKETKLTAKERRLVEMVQDAMGYPEEGEDAFNPADAADEEDYRRDQYQGNQMEEGDEMADETVIPEYNTIDELMNSIDHGTNKVAEEHKMQEMKKIAEALRMKAKKMEESEHAAHISPKDLKQLATDAAKLEKAAEKLKAAFDKKFNKKEKAPAAPKAEKVEALQEGFFDLRKFLAENKLTASSRMLSENGTYTQKEILRGSMQGFKAPNPEELKVNMMIAPNMSYGNSQEQLNQEMGRITAISGDKVTYKKGDGKLYNSDVADIIIVAS
jgi:hypothetical protein